MITLNDPTREQFLAAAKPGETIQFTLNLEGKEFVFERTSITEADFDDLYNSFTFAKARTIRSFYTGFYLEKLHQSANWSRSAVTLCHGVVDHIKRNFPAGNLYVLQSIAADAVEKEQADQLAAKEKGAES